ncbi:MAG: hypothetical protein ACKVH8_07845 [Pirellulales bacterium]|jgi:hypothetical protein
MPDKFDPYREGLVVEEETLWPEELGEWEAADKQQMEKALHKDAESCANLEYVRVHTGFCRSITVTQDDVDRVNA